MADNALTYGLVSEQTIRDALATAKGDIFLAAAYVGVTARQLDGHIRTSETLQGFVAAIQTVKADADYDRMSTEQFEARIEHLTRAYKVDALEEIHKLATIPMGSGETAITAAMADVKLKAAVQLRGAGVESHSNSEQAQVMAELNQLYQQAAPRIKSIRAVQIEFKEE